MESPIERPKRRLPAPAAVGMMASVAVHVLMALGLSRLPPGGPAPIEASQLDVEVISDRGAPRAGSSPGTATAPPRPPEPGGPESAQNVDSSRRGGGGDATGPGPVILLLDRSDPVTLQDSPMNATTGQTQRIRTARDRASWENRRSTPNPDDRPFLASGAGPHPERRPLARSNAAPGARHAPEAGRRGEPTRERPDERPHPHGHGGDLPTAEASPAGEYAARPPGGAQPQDRGGPADSPGRGVLGGRGSQRTEAARADFGRPPVDEAPAATAAAASGRVRDDTDAELLAASMVESFVESTRRRGRRVGAGTGGRDARGEPGSGTERGTGGRAAVHSPGPGPYPALDTGDARYQHWYLEQRRRVEQALVFPHDREVSMDQGTTVYRVVVRRDGSLAHRPRLLRSSGFDDFDAAALTAIERAVPFRPLPAELAPSHEAIRVTLAVQFANPMVR